MRCFQSFSKPENENLMHKHEVLLLVPLHDATEDMPYTTSKTLVTTVE